MAEKTKITYTTLSADNEDLHQGIDAALKRISKLRGETFPLIIGGEAREVDETFAVYSPIDTRDPLFHFQNGTAADSRDAIAAAREAFPTWSLTPWQERADLLDKVAAWIDDNVFDLAAAMMLEMGKNRLEALAEVAETSDILRYYTTQIRELNGFVDEMPSQTGSDQNTSTMKPYGVWSVISPFNFPLALAIAPVGAALLTGNTVVLKPALEAPYTTLRTVQAFYELGLPAGCLSYITGPDETAANELVQNDDVDGITFTGSYEVGFNIIYDGFAGRYPKPVITEMGGKNPVIISEKANLDKAVLGVMRGAFGLGGQKCSASSRVYIQEGVYDEFKQRLIDLTNETVTIGDPTERTTFLGPIGTVEAYEKFKRVAEQAKKDGKVVLGGEVLTEGEKAHGYYVTPTIVEGLPQGHEFVQTELFLPVVALLKVASLDEAMEQANDTALGLTAGIFSEDEDEIDWFFNNIEAGVVYANRSGGATTGAWPGFQTFGGWKGSGSTGPNIFGRYSLIAYMREQSQTVYR